MNGPVFLHIARGNRIEHYMRMQRVVEGHPHRLAQDYTYMELPLASALNNDGEMADKAAANQMLVLQSAITLQPVNNYKVLVSVNPQLSYYGACPSQLIIDPSDKPQRIEVPVHFRKAFQLSELTWLFRLYLVS